MYSPELVSVRGQFSTRGGILDVYPLSFPEPVRIELFGDEIDSIRTFDVASQRSIARIQGATLYPTAEETLQNLALKEGSASLVSLLEGLIPDAAVMLLESDRIHSEAEQTVRTGREALWRGDFRRSRGSRSHFG